MNFLWALGAALASLALLVIAFVPLERAFLLGFRVAALAGLAAFRGLWAIFVHSNARLPLGPLRTLFGAPELHHFHHARVGRTRHNFANVAPWIDLLFGTHHLPTGDE